MRLFGRRAPAPLLDRHDPESEPDAVEVSGADIPQPENAAELLALVRERFELAQRARQDLEPEWATCIAHERGYSHLKYNAGTRMLEDGRDPDNPDFWQPTNIIRGLGQNTISRLTTLEPGVLISPQTQRPLDVESAEEARVVEDHYSALFDSRNQIRALGHLAWTVGDSWLLQYWDPFASAEVPIEWDEENQPTAYGPRRVGDLVERIVPGWEVYADPRADSWAHCRWIIHAVSLPFAEIEERFGRIPSVPTAGVSDVWRSLIDAFTSPWSGSNSQATQVKQSTVHFMYEVDSPRLPRGRVVVTCGDEVYHTGPLPCGTIPLLHLGYQEQVGTAYNRGVVCDLVGPQFSYNLLQSRWLAERNNRKYIFFRDVNDGSGADVEERLAAPVEETGNYVTIWSRGGVGQMGATPMVHSDTPAALGFIESQMGNIAGVRLNDLLNQGGEKPSGYALRLMLDADTTQNAPFSARLERFLEERSRRRLKIVSEYVREPRAWGLDDSKNPDEGSVSVSLLPALTSGGAAVIRVQKGSLTPSTPEAQDSSILEWAQAGLLGDPTSPDTQDVVLGLLSNPAAGRALEALKKRRELEQKRAVIATQLDEKMGQNQGQYHG